MKQTESPDLKLGLNMHPSGYYCGPKLKVLLIHCDFLEKPFHSVRKQQLYVPMDKGKLVLRNPEKGPLDNHVPASDVCYRSSPHQKNH